MKHHDLLFCYDTAMAEETPEQAFRRHAQAVVSADIGTALRTMTPEAFAKAMEIGNQTWIITSFDLTDEGRDGNDYLFVATYQTDLGTMRLRYRLRDVDGAWKVVDIDHAP